MSNHEEKKNQKNISFFTIVFYFISLSVVFFSPVSMSFHWSKGPWDPIKEQIDQGYEIKLKPNYSTPGRDGWRHLYKEMESGKPIHLMSSHHLDEYTGQTTNYYLSEKPNVWGKSLGYDNQASRVDLCERGTYLSQDLTFLNTKDVVNKVKPVSFRFYLKYFNEHRWACTQCPSGTYSNVDNNPGLFTKAAYDEQRCSYGVCDHNCKPCPNGTYAPWPGHSQCQKCTKAHNTATECRN